MNYLILIVLITASSCSSIKNSKQTSILLNRDCNPTSARLSGKEYTQEEQQLNNVTFDQCSKNENTIKAPYEVNRIQPKSTIVSDALMYKCEVAVNGNNYAASNKIRNNAEKRVEKKCLSFEDHDDCSNVRCIEL